MSTTLFDEHREQEIVESVEHQIEICRSKAGILPDEPVKLYRFEVKRYK